MRHHGRWISLLPWLALLIAAPACAQNASTAGALELYPTFGAIGARLAYTGDDNLNATAYLEWRRTGDVAWTRGVDMTRITNRRWAGSVLWLLPRHAYDVRSVIQDPEGGSSATGAVATRDDAAPPATGRTWYVATGGNDAGAGDSGHPLATIQAAADRAQPGDAIRVFPGIYYQTVTLSRSGDALRFFHLVADGPGVVIDGSDPAYLNRADWRNDGGGIYSLPFAGESRIVGVDSLQRLFHTADLASLQANSTGLGQGWVAEGGRLYVKLEGGSSPVGHKVHVGRYDVGIRMQGNYWRVDGFEVRYFGTSFPDWDYVSGGITLIGARSCIVSHCHVQQIGGRFIFLRSGAADNLVEANLVRDPRLSVWPWGVVKGTHDQELTGISNRAGRGNVIRGNTIIGTFNGVDARIREVTTDEDVAADADFENNLMRQIGDDAVETDEVSGINVRVLRNRIENVFVGISIAPIYQGPQYVLYNTISTFTRSAFKPAGANTGHAWSCHNTCYGPLSGFSAVWPTGAYSNLHFRNNIFLSTGKECVTDDAGESATGNDYDGDCLRSNAWTILFRWKDVNYTMLAALRGGTGFELRGIVADPGFVSAGSGDFTLVAGSPAVDAGIRLPGINDGFVGLAPDIGAYERGAPLGIGERLEGSEAGLGPPRPNPAQSGAVFPFSLPRAAPARFGIYDLEGRLVRRLADGVFAPGAHSIPWDGRDAMGRPAPAGLYFVRAQLGERVLSARVAVVH